MPKLPQTLLEKWIYALKPKSWLKLLVPFFLGQSIGLYSIYNTASVISTDSILRFGVGSGIIALMLASIVLLNDWADEKVDTLKRTLFPEGCSPKTIPDKILSARSLFIGGTASSIGVVFIAFAFEMYSSLENFTGYTLASLCIFFIYSLPPLRLNYRGGGELLEMIGVGFVLPVYHGYLQSSKIIVVEVPWIISSYVAFALASAIASGLSDEESDVKGKKTTFVTVFGNQNARRLIHSLFFVGLLLLCGNAITAFLTIQERNEYILLSFALGAFIVAAWNFVKLRQYSPLATTNAFQEQALFKNVLHKGMWHPMLLIALGYFLTIIFP